VSCKFRILPFGPKFIPGQLILVIYFYYLTKKTSFHYALVCFVNFKHTSIMDYAIEPFLYTYQALSCTFFTKFQKMTGVTGNGEGNMGDIEFKSFRRVNFTLPPFFERFITKWLRWSQYVTKSPDILLFLHNAE